MLGARTSEAHRSYRSRGQVEPLLLAAVPALASQFQSWQGASGRRYVHTVFPLILCPVLPQANYILVRREADGTRTVLRVGCTTSEAESLNLAEIRRRGAQLGANEVHVHLLGETAEERADIERDLRCGGLAGRTAEAANQAH